MSNKPIKQIISFAEETKNNFYIEKLKEYFVSSGTVFSISCVSEDSAQWHESIWSKLVEIVDNDSGESIDLKQKLIENVAGLCNGDNFVTLDFLTSNKKQLTVLILKSFFDYGDFNHLTLWLKVLIKDEIVFLSSGLSNNQAEKVYNSLTPL